MKQKMKLVRIDARTVIEIPITKSSEEARREYDLKISENRRKFENREINKRWKV